MSSGVISLTFDDGLQSTFEHAAPILARYSMPATVGLICDRLLWHRIPVAMSLENARTLAASGWEIASHSLFHRRMEKLPPTFADEVLAGWQPRGSGVFAAACPWEDVGTVAEDQLYLPRRNSLDALRNTETGFFHDLEQKLIYARPRVASDLDDRLKLGSTERELQGSRAVLEELGFDIQSFILPFSLWREGWGPIAWRHYRFVASVGDRINMPGQRPFLHRIRTRAEVPADHQISKIEKYIEQGGWPILCLHQVCPEPQTPLDWPVSEFERMVDWIASSGLTACTLAEGARRIGINPPALHTR